MQEWQKDYIKYYEQKNRDELIRIKKKYMPKKLYKFFPCKEKSLNNLFNSKIYLSSPEEFNDPYDSKPLFCPDDLWRFALKDEMLMKVLDSYGISKNILDNNIIEYSKFVYRLQRSMLDYMTNFRISCFTENDYTSMLMWSHYANAHSGFCLEFNTDSFTPEQLYDIHPVIYSDKIYDLTFCLCKLLKSKLKRYQESKRIYFEISTLHKDLSWSYEKEWRIIKADTTFAMMSKPSAIYLGVNIDDEDRKKISEWCNSCNIPIFNMRQKGNEYKLVPKRIFQAQIQSSKEVQACEVL